VIVFEPPAGGRYFIKRIIGLPNEKIRIQDGEIAIFDHQGNKTVLKENYLPLNIKTFGDLEVVLEPNQYFVLGDNRNYSFDSRAWGSLAKERIIGLAKLRIWPINAAMAFGRPTY
jgi:signal peptidase I